MNSPHFVSGFRLVLRLVLMILANALTLLYAICICAPPNYKTLVGLSLACFLGQRLSRNTLREWIEQGIQPIRIRMLCKMAIPLAIISLSGFLYLMILRGMGPILTGSSVHPTDCSQMCFMLGVSYQILAHITGIDQV